ncbi:DnaD domain protein [Staphylococcus saprophyticus]|nr:DnaD domain protein [Staphylococcus saprophyticus]
MEQTPSYYSIITAEVRYDNNLTDSEKLLYAEITSLSNKYGYCTASNNYFAKLYEVSKVTISRRVSNLRNHGYLKVELIRENNEIKQRKLYPLTNVYTPINNSVNTPHNNSVNSPINTNVKENNTSINTTRNNNTSSNSSCGGNNISIVKNNESNKHEQQQQLQSFNFYQENGFGMLSPFIQEEISYWLDTFESNADEIVIGAMKEALSSNVTNWKYVNTILKSWHNKGVKNIDDVKAILNQKNSKNKELQGQDLHEAMQTDEYWGF